MTPLLARQVEKLACLWHVDAFARLLVRWHVKMKSWHAFGTWARGHVDHAGRYGMHGCDLIYSASKINIKRRHKKAHQK